MLSLHLGVGVVESGSVAVGVVDEHAETAIVVSSTIKRSVFRMIKNPIEVVMVSSMKGGPTRI